MEINDVQTIRIQKSNGSFLKAIEHDWLRYLGYTDEEIQAEELVIVVKAERSESHKQNFIGMGKPFKK